MHLPQYLRRVPQYLKRGPASREKPRSRPGKPTVERLEDRITPADFFVTNLTQFTSAMRNVMPGDTVTMADGTWANVNLLFKPNQNGVPTPSITLRAQTPGQVILTGSSQLRIAGNDLLVDGLQFTGTYTGTGRDVVAFRESSTGVQSDHSRLTNCAIVDYNPPVAETDTRWVSIFGTNNRVDHCFFSGKTNQGQVLVVWVTPGQPNNDLIDHNYFTRPDECTVQGCNGETIRVGDSSNRLDSSETIVESNYFYRCNGELEMISNKSSDNTYRYNTFVECQGTLTLRFGNRCTVEANYFFGGSVANTGGVRITGDDHRVFNNYFANLRTTALHPERAAVSFVMGTNTDLGYFQAQRAVVAFNTFVDDTANFAIGVEGHPVGTLEPLDCTIANNVVRGSTGPLVIVVHEPTNMTWEGNIMFGAPVGITTAGITEVDPLLSLAADGLFRPDAASPVIGAAVGDYPFVTTDMDGQARPDVGKDVGADQVSSDPITRPPLTPSDVRPSWMMPPGGGGGGSGNPGGQTANERFDARALLVALGNRDALTVSLPATVSPNDLLFRTSRDKDLITILDLEFARLGDGTL
jgi:poly(beta-D-mannuronate) lyase